MAEIDDLLDRVAEYDEELGEDLEMEHMQELCRVADEAGRAVGALFMRLSWCIGGPFEDGFLEGCAEGRDEESPRAHMSVADDLEDLAALARQRAELLEDEEEFWEEGPNLL